VLPNWFTAFLVMLMEAWSARRDAHIRFLKLQVEMLRSRLPGNRVILDPAERQRLMKVGAEVGHAVEDTLGIVSIKTYRQWLREERVLSADLKNLTNPRGGAVAASWSGGAGAGVVGGAKAWRQAAGRRVHPEGRLEADSSVRR
jgi:hypothetical protein